jgi:hypothetical protein
VLFSVFQTTLSSLSLFRVALTWEAFIDVVDYFPNLRDLPLGQYSFAGDRRVVSPLSIPPRGKLRLSSLLLDNMSTLSSGFSASELQFDELETISMGDHVGI